MTTTTTANTVKQIINITLYYYFMYYDIRDCKWLKFAATIEQCIHDHRMSLQYEVQHYLPTARTNKVSVTNKTFC